MENLYFCLKPFNEAIAFQSQKSTKASPYAVWMTDALGIFKGTWLD